MPGVGQAYAGVDEVSGGVFLVQGAEDAGGVAEPGEDVGDQAAGLAVVGEVAGGGPVPAAAGGVAAELGGDGGEDETQSGYGDA